MAITWTATLKKHVFTGNSLEVYGTLAGTGTYTTGGDTLSFAGFDGIKASSAPDWIEVQYQPVAGTPITANTEFVFNKGTTIANGKLQLFSATATEYSGSAPTGVIVFQAIWFNRDI